MSDADHTSFDDAISKGSWEPGSAFSFLALDAIAKGKEMDVKDFLDKLDTSGKMQKELNKREDMPDYPAEHMLCLKDPKEDTYLWSNDTPIAANFDENVSCDDSALDKNELSFAKICDACHGNDMKGRNTLMETLKSNSYAVAGLKYSNSDTLKRIWNAADNFFDNINDETVPSIDVVPETGSNKTVTGHASCDNDSAQFLATRLQRMNNDDNFDDDNVIMHPKNIFED